MQHKSSLFTTLKSARQQGMVWGTKSIGGSCSHIHNVGSKEWRDLIGVSNQLMPVNLRNTEEEFCGKLLTMYPKR